MRLRKWSWSCRVTGVVDSPRRHCTQHGACRALGEHAENTSMQPGGCCGRDVPALSTAPAHAHVHLLKADSTAQRGSAADAALSTNAQPGDLLRAPSCWGRRRRLLAEHPAISSHQGLLPGSALQPRDGQRRTGETPIFKNTVHFLRVSRSHGELLLPSHPTELRAHRC